DGRYRLCIATCDIDSDGIPSEAQSASIGAGRHRLALEQHQAEDAWRIAVAWDGTALLTVKEPEDWDPALGSEGGGQYSVSDQLGVDKPAVLFRRRFMRESSDGLMTTPSGPTDGILLWIEKIDGPDTGP